MISETLTVIVSALIWWIPTFVALSDLQNRQGVPRAVLWKWTAVLAVPVVGAAVYWWRGRPRLERQTGRDR